MLDRLGAWECSPFQKTVALDSDTYVMGDLSDLFVLLEKFDFACAHGHMREARHRLAVEVGAITDIPYAFAPLQGGLVCYSAAENSARFIAELKQRYIEKQYFDDQVTMRELLWSGRYSFSILPPEYNFNSLDNYLWWEANEFRYCHPKLFHYTLNKNVDIQDFVRENFAARYVAPRFDHAGV
jgi:hypothetical protein